MAYITPKPTKPFQLSSTGGQASAATPAGALAGIFIATAGSTPTVTVYDNTTGSGTVLIPTFTPVAGTYYAFPEASFTNGCYIVLGGTVTGVAFIRT
jgi:hypothetical protein